MIRGSRSRAPLLVFGLSLAAIYAVALALVSRMAQLESSELIAGALTLDLTLLVPVLYYLLLVRWRGWPAVTVLPVFIGSVLLAGRVIPDAHHRVLGLVEYGMIAAVGVLAGILAHKLIQLRRAYREQTAEDDVYARLRVSAESVLGLVVGNLLAYEMAVLYYLLFGWRRAPRDEPLSFTYHRSSAYLVIVVAVMLVACAELGGMHLLISKWSPTVAWIVSVISVYALLWLIGDAHAIRLRPIRLSETMLHIRVGLRSTIDVPLASIARVGTPNTEKLSHRTPGYLKSVLLGAPNLRIELNTQVDAQGPYGLTMRAKTIDLRVDDPESLGSEVRRSISALADAN